MQALYREIRTTDTTAPIIQWDCIQGYTPVVGGDAVTLAAIQAICGGTDAAEATANPTDALIVARKLPARSVLFLVNAHNGFEVANWKQAFWNLREIFKGNTRMAVILAPRVSLPMELSSDVVVLDEPLPDEAQLERVIRNILKSSKVDNPDDAGLIARAVEAVSGLANFPAEQVTAMSLTRENGPDSPITIDMDQMWERKRQMIEQTPGLSVWRGGETFDDIGGYSNIKNFLQRLISSRKRPRVVCLWDELEKSLSGATSGTSDSSGVSQGFLGSVLSYMQDEDVKGVILIGPPGACKTMLAKAMGNTAKIPTIVFDLTGMKASLVGESEARLKNALKVVTAVGQGQAFFIGTCNKIAALPNELKRRFTRGTFFVDLPTEEERKQIWAIYLKKYSLAEQPLPDSHDWTGAEIKQACELASEDVLNCSLVEAAGYIVPVAQSGAAQLQELRRMADGTFINASSPGKYRWQSGEVASGAARAISVE
jgi:hypothetical protein